MTTGVKLYCIIMTTMKAIVLALLATLLLLGTACGPALVAVTIPNLDDVTEALGYSLAPAYMPEGFEFDQYDVSGSGTRTIKPDDMVVMPRGEPYAILFYDRYENYANHNILIQYPWSFSSSAGDDILLERLGIEWRRPDDAVSEVKVNGKAAYLVRGSWSAESLQTLENPEWDYDIYLSLYFDYKLSQDETVGVMMRAMFYPAEWITSNEMFKSAESLQRVD